MLDASISDNKSLRIGVISIPVYFFAPLMVEYERL